MLYHSKGLDLEITDFESHGDRTYAGGSIPSQTSKFVMRGYYLICETESSIPRAERVKKGEAR